MRCLRDAFAHVHIAVTVAVARVLTETIFHSWK